MRSPRKIGNRLQELVKYPGSLKGLSERVLSRGVCLHGPKRNLNRLPESWLCTTQPLQKGSGGLLLMRTICSSLPSGASSSAF